MRLYPKLNFTIIGIVPALLLFACKLALAQSVPVTTTPTRELEGHTRGVISIAFSLDGRRIASGSRDKTIKLWETETGNPVRTFQGHNEEVTSVAFSPDARWIASAARDKTIKIWDTSTDMVRTLGIDSSERPVVTFSPDGRSIATGSLDGALNVWDVATLSLVRTFQTDGGVFSATFSSDGRWLAASRGKNVIVWEVLTGEVVHTLEGHQLNVLSIAFSPDNRRLASASADETVKLWDISTAKPVLTFTFSKHQGSVVFVAFSPDANSIVSGGDSDNLIILWDAATGKTNHMFEGEGLLTCVAASIDGKWIASGVDRNIKLWEPPVTR